MITRVLIFLIVFSSCSNTELNNKHRYLIIEEKFKKIEQTNILLEEIYQVLGRPTESLKENDLKHLFCDETKTMDLKYTITLKNNKLMALMITPSENKKNYLMVKDALKIFSHLKLNKSQRWNTSNPHVVYEEFFYRTQNNKFEIQFDSKNRVDNITWFK